jgi:hypothetical protein
MRGHGASSPRSRRAKALARELMVTSGRALPDAARS